MTNRQDPQQGQEQDLDEQMMSVVDRFRSLLRALLDALRAFGGSAKDAMRIVSDKQLATDIAMVILGMATVQRNLWLAIAERAPNPKVRAYAVGNVERGDDLFLVANGDVDETVAAKALARITQDALLLRIAYECSYESIALVAFHRIQDHVVVASVLVRAADSMVSDQTESFDYHRQAFLCGAAIERVYTPSLVQVYCGIEVPTTHWGAKVSRMIAEAVAEKVPLQQMVRASVGKNRARAAVQMLTCELMHDGRRSCVDLLDVFDMAVCVDVEIEHKGNEHGICRLLMERLQIAAYGSQNGYADYTKVAETAKLGCVADEALAFLLSRRVELPDSTLVLIRRVYKKGETQQARDRALQILQARDAV